ncbi:unnamed protein product [Urochloa humidicola]
MSRRNDQRLPAAPALARVLQLLLACSSRPSSSRCCGHVYEDCFHVVIVCPQARALRDQLREKILPASGGTLIQSGPEWLLSIVERYDAATVVNFFMLIWRCWSVRNKLLQEGEEISIGVLFLSRYMDALTSFRQQHAEDVRGKQKMFPCRPTQAIGKPSGCRWAPPREQELKANVDGAFINETGKAAIGVVMRDCRGRPLVSAWRTLTFCRDAEDAEAQACLVSNMAGSETDT